MAVVNNNQAKRKIEREKKKYNAVKKKADIIEKKEAFGSAWKQSLSEEDKLELKQAIGDADCPSVVDVIDAHQFFEPINLFRNENGDVNQFKYDKYLEAEEAYKTSIDELDKVIYEEDVGTNDAASMLQDELDKRSGKTGKEINKKPRLPEYLSKQYEKWAKHFNRIVPVYDRYVCTCCGRPLVQDKYYVLYNESDLGRIEIDGKMHTHICKDCCKRLYEYLYYEKADKNAELAMQWFCSYLNVYYDESSFLSAKKNMDEKIANEKLTHIVDEYFDIINKSASLKGKVFLESKDIGVGLGVKGNRKDAQIINSKDGSIADDTEDGTWTQSELKAKQLVLRLVGHDPYYYYPSQDRKVLYKDLLNMLGEDEMDGLRINGATQIVLSFLKIRQIEEMYRKRWEEGAGVAELKALTDLKTKELDTITKFSRDNGFGEAYNKAKNNNANSFCSIMAKMNEMKYEDALINKYDIDTSSTIQAAADASYKAIFNQLNLSEAEIYKTCSDQLKRLVDLQRENASLQEEIRLVKKELATKKLEEQKRQHDLENPEERWNGY